jgi:hypothetical protein
MKRQYFSFCISFLFILVIGMGTLTRLCYTESIKISNQVMVSRPYYHITANYNPQKDEVKGHLVVTLAEMRSGGPLTEVYFHLYPNVFQNWRFKKESKPTQPGYLKISNVKVDTILVKKTIKDTIMKITLSKPLAVGKSVRIEMDYILHLPHGGTRLNTYKNTAFLAQWYPILAVKDQDGWHIEPYTTTGDPFYTQMSDFEVTFQVPRGYQVITTGYDKSYPRFTDTITVKQENVRDFAAVLTKDYEVLRGSAKNKTQVNLWYLKGMKDVSSILHNAAISGMNFYSEKFGNYPYPEVDVVLGDTGYGIAGMEYPGLVTSVPKVPTKKGDVPAINVVVHELAHQWWYGVVGNNQVKEPWLDEGLTTFSEFLYMQEKMKTDEKEFLERATLKSNQIYRITGVTSAESLYKYPDLIYGLMVYIRPAAMMYNLIDQIGKEKVMEIMRTYYHKYQYQTATSRDFIVVANKVAGYDLTPFFQKWLYFKNESHG